MTEAEWQACTVFSPMLAFLREKGSDRKMRLFACACCRRIWHLIIDERSRSAVEVSERIADGNATREELAAAESAASAAVDELRLTGLSQTAGSEAALFAAFHPTTITNMDVVDYASLASAAAVRAAMWVNESRWKAIRDEEKMCQVLLLREIFGPLLFRPIAPSKSWRTPSVKAVAQAIYDNHAFERLPILGDALEEAGCVNGDILNHCRADGPHVRGCWVVDMILETE